MKPGWSVFVFFAEKQHFLSVFTMSKAWPFFGSAWNLRLFCVVFTELLCCQDGLLHLRYFLCVIILLGPLQASTEPRCQSGAGAPTGSQEATKRAPSYSPSWIQTQKQRTQPSQESQRDTKATWRDTAQIEWNIFNGYRHPTWRQKHGQQPKWLN